MTKTDDTEAKTIKSMREAFSMTKQRCYNPNQRDYKYYGGRGIKIADSWLESFDNFIKDMGIRPEGKTLERKDNNGDYCKENCEWATRASQVVNRELTLKLTINGRTMPIAEWSKETGIPYGTLKARKTRLGYTDEECISKPVAPGKMLDGQSYSKRKYSTAISEEKVYELRRDIASGKETIESVAEKLKVTKDTVKAAYKGVKAYAKLPKTN